MSIRHRMPGGIPFELWSEGKRRESDALTAECADKIISAHKKGLGLYPWVWVEDLDRTNWSGKIMLDDQDTYGVFHPETPVEVASAVETGDKKRVVELLLDILNGKVFSGRTVGGSPENTCPQCGARMRSSATRRKIYYNCTVCSYKSSSEDPACPDPA